MRTGDFQRSFREVELRFSFLAQLTAFAHFVVQNAACAFPDEHAAVVKVSSSHFATVYLTIFSPI